MLVAASAAAWAGDPLLDELGLKSGNQIDHGAYKITEYRFKDVTGAYAGSFAIPNGVRFGNVVLTCEGKCPKPLPAPANHRDGALPVIPSYLPAKGLVPGSERYVLGPVGLSQSTTEISPAAVAFQFGTEAAIGKYQTGRSEAILAMFMYPTPQMARQQLPELQKIPGVVAKRSGPVVGVVLHASDEATANALLENTKYQASISWDEQPPLIIRPQTAAQIVLGGMELAGIILVFCVVSGVAYGAFRVLQAKFGSGDAEHSVIALRLSDK